MYFNITQLLGGFCILTLFYTHLASAGQKDASNTTLTAQPASCVTLHQGRECFANITIDWQSTDIGDYCLYQDKRIIHCWQNSNQNTTSLTFESSENITFYLMKRTSKAIMAQTTITVGWVHKGTPRKRRWRLF